METKVSSSIVTTRRSIADLVAITTGALMWPLTPIWPIATALAACLIGIAFGYVRERKRPHLLPLLALGGTALFASLVAAFVIKEHAPNWIAWGAWIGFLLGLTAGWEERELARDEGTT